MAVLTVSVLLASELTKRGFERTAWTTDFTFLEFLTGHFLYGWVILTRSSNLRDSIYGEEHLLAALSGLVLVMGLYDRVALYRGASAVLAC